MRLVVGFLAAAAITALPAHAQEPAASGPVTSTGIAFSVGSFQPARSEPASTGRGYAFRFAVQRRRPSGLRYALEMNIYEAHYVTPAAVSCFLCDRKMSLTVVGIGPSVAYEWRLGAADLYAGAGLGLYWSNLQTSNVLVLVFNGVKKHDRSVGADFRAGVLFDVGKSSGLGIEYRRLSLRGQFEELSNGASMPIGGEFVQGIFRKTF